MIMKTFLAIGAIALMNTAATAATEPVAPPASETQDVSTSNPTPGPAAPEARVVGEFGDWTVSCMDSAPGVSGCAARQDIKLSEDEKAPGPRLAIFIEKAGSKAPLMMSVGTPLGILVQPGVSMILSPDDQAAVWQADFSACMQDMCVAGAAVNEKLLLSAQTPAIAFMLADSQVIGVPFSVKGIAEAVTALASETDKPDEEGDLLDPGEPAATPESSSSSGTPEDAMKSE